MKLKERARTRKGRGFGSDDRPERRDKGRYDAVDDAQADEPGPQRCKLLHHLMLDYLLQIMEFVPMIRVLKHLP